MKILPLLIFVILLTFSCGCVLDTYPSISEDGNDLSVKTIAIDFPYKDKEVTGFVELKLAPYSGAKLSKKTAVLYGKTKDSGWEEKYYDAMINDASLTDLYSRLIEFFDSYSAANSFDSDEYAEMVTSFVQTIPYRTEESNTRFPIETVVDNYGDCDDKSILLSGILSRKGYDVALLNFGNHMTAAINSSGSYKMIETTSYAYITEEVNLSEFNVETNVPKIYKIGEGMTPYYSEDKVDAVLKTYTSLLSDCAVLYSKISGLEKVIEDQKASLNERYDNELRIACNKNIDAYNSYVSQYKKKSEALSKLSLGRYNLEGAYEVVKGLS
ncbi:MAG: hypothetical protein Q4Q53_00735 [Methanocorpusculum sp.]|nr:hypothetical protein [Methanocorpusculum sp.]